MYPADQQTILNDLVAKKAGLDTVVSDIFKAAKRRLLNSLLLAKLQESKEYEEKVPDDVKGKISSFVSLSVSILL